MPSNWYFNQQNTRFDWKHNGWFGYDRHYITVVLFTLVSSWFVAHKENSGTRLTLGMCSGAQWRGGGGTGHYRLLRAHAGPRGRWRQTGQPPHKASNQSAPIHCRRHRDPIGRMGVGNQGQKTLGVRSAQSRLPADRIWFNINPPACLSLPPHNARNVTREADVSSTTARTGTNSLVLCVRL